MMEPVVLDLNAVVADMESMLRRLIGEDVQLTTVLEAGLNHIRGDVGLISHVLMTSPSTRATRCRRAAA
jgi:two-component system, cell cycle sensor histidine kinase and response regulator CckA